MKNMLNEVIYSFQKIEHPLSSDDYCFCYDGERVLLLTREHPTFMPGSVQQKAPFSPRALGI
jgi:hypothetical protein